MPPLTPTTLPSTSKTTTSKGSTTSRPGSSASVPKSATTGSQHRRSDASLSPSLLETQSPSMNSTIFSSVTTSSPTATQMSQNATPSNSYVNGNYTCSTDVDATFFLSILQGMLKDPTNIGAHLNLVTFNLHLLQQGNSSSKVSPTSDSFLSTLLQNRFSGSMYTPQDLLNDRMDLNSSWFYHHTSVAPDFYYSLEKSPTGVLSTSDGWPTAEYLQSIKSVVRVLFSFGTVDADVATEYDISNDANVVFPSEIIENVVPFDKSQCPTDTIQPSVSSFNTSWLSAYDSAAGPFALSSIVDISNCGTSAVINSSSSNISAAVEPMSYFDFLKATVWSWDDNEPINDTTTGSDMFRCTTFGSNGRWRVENCANKYSVACRVSNQPYSWIISQNADSYFDAQSACPFNSSFAVPRTAVQNRYLLLKMQENAALSSERLWVDWNSLAVSSCWVSGGPNATCPYSATEQRDPRYIIVPTVAAVIVLVIFALFLFVKLANHRVESSRRRRRKHWKRYAGNLMYEGVPS